MIGELTLTRDKEMDETCTLGVLSVFGAVFQTIEDPWNDNRPFGSCIPEGVYAMVHHNTPAHPDTWALVNPSLNIYHLPSDMPVGDKKARYACLIHPGNTAKDVEGCIAIGQSRGAKSVLSSQKAMAAFRTLMRDSKFQHFNLRIVRA